MIESDGNIPEIEWKCRISEAEAPKNTIVA